MIINLLPRVGFGWTIRICAFLILTLLLFANFALKRRIEPVKRPIEFLAFVRPLREPAFALWTAAVFFYYCALVKRLYVIHETNFPPRGDVHSLHFHRRPRNRPRHVASPGAIPCLHLERYKVRKPAPGPCDNCNKLIRLQPFRAHRAQCPCRQTRTLQRNDRHGRFNNTHNPRPLAPVNRQRTHHPLRSALRRDLRRWHQSYARSVCQALAHSRHWRPHRHSLYNIGICRADRVAHWRCDYFK